MRLFSVVRLDIVTEYAYGTHKMTYVERYTTWPLEESGGNHGNTHRPHAYQIEDIVWADMLPIHHPPYLGNYGSGSRFL